MLRGEVRVVDLEPARGSEAGGRRPSVVVSNDDSNETVARLGRGRVTIVPLTTSVERVHSFQVLLSSDETGLRADSKVQTDQVRAVTLERVGPVVGRLGWASMTAVDDAIRLHLDL